MAKISFVAPRSFAFLKESLAIEGISRNPTEAELAATEKFLSLKSLGISDIKELQAVYTPNCPLRVEAGMNVHVGMYTPPRGSISIDFDLGAILCQANTAGTKRCGVSGIYAGAFEVHMLFELLHPFMDGNGRTGRALWAWVINRHGVDPFGIPFLQSFYYSTLEYFSRRENEFFEDEGSFEWHEHN